MEHYELERVLPEEIEKRSFEIITKELGSKKLDPENELVIKRVIHTSADFDYADNLIFSPHAVTRGLEALKEGTAIITDTNMGKAGINKAALKRLHCTVDCFMADEDVAQEARQNETTRAHASMDKASRLPKDCIFAIGNAPTALVRLYELVQQGIIRPKLIIGVPVGFVNVVQSKEMILSLTDVPYIVARGRKGGSNVAAAIVNALMYQVK
ncbi:precorrin-8X methylmutase [Clostridium sp. HBUAS56010]|uniref:precorrin-8X methylmutase n=1 Tax=Clostridium sp. HBUAS56010 TaxID=2571127 RepID=UPI0011780068|nr:precorrin-8X methylmutase [Clostridium sp. HBUAS56010]